MMSKLLVISKIHPVLSVLVRGCCWILFKIINIWNELCGFIRNIGIGGKTYKSLKLYRNKYGGERCFIIATGPSLTINDLELLKNEITFSMNSVVRVYGDVDFRPTYYGIQDHIVYAELENELLKIYEGCDNVFISDRIKWHSKIGEKWNIYPLNMSYNAYKRWFKNIFYAKFSDNVFRRVYNGFSITHSLIEIAVYMGFKEIYLIGADCNFPENEKLHFIEHGVEDKTIDTARERNIAGYEAAKKYADKHGIKIYNASRGGKLEVFERINLDMVLTIM